MKKIATVLAAFVLLLPLSAYADPIIPGYKGDEGVSINSPMGANCIVWRETMTKEERNSGNGRVVCKEEGNAKRLYELEVAVQALQQQNDQLQAKLSQAQVSGGVVSDSNVEYRLSNLESNVSAMQKTVITVLQLVLNFIKTH
jgi:hypothetical protein